MTSNIQYLPDYYVGFGYYDYKGLYYSGTKMQPDLITLFTKSGGVISSDRILHKHNWIDMVPLVGAFTAIPRIVAAVKSFFHEANQVRFQRNDPHLAECWNAFKNLMRGVVALVPLIGTFSLIWVETIRFARDYMSLKKSLAMQENIIGIAVDGKVIFTSDLNLYRQRIFPEALMSLRVRMDLFIKRIRELNLPVDMEQILTELGRLTNNSCNTPIPEQNGQPAL